MSRWAHPKAVMRITMTPVHAGASMSKPLSRGLREFNRGFSKHLFGIIPKGSTDLINSTPAHIQSDEGTKADAFVLRPQARGPAVVPAVVMLLDNYLIFDAPASQRVIASGCPISWLFSQAFSFLLVLPRFPCCLAFRTALPLIGGEGGSGVGRGRTLAFVRQGS